MPTDLQFFLIFVAATVGGIFTALLGWCESGESFNPRKFMASVMRAIGGAIVIVGVEFVFPNGVTLKTYFLAVLAGMGADVLGNRAAGAIAVRVKPPT